MAACLVVETSDHLQVVSVPIVFVSGESIRRIEILIVDYLPIGVGVIGCHRLHLTRVFRILYIHLPVVIAQVPFLITEIGLCRQIFMNFEDEIEFGGHFLSQIVASGTSLLHHSDPSVRREVRRRVSQRSISHRRSVGIHRDETGQTVHSRTAPVGRFALHSRISIATAKHACGILNFEPWAHLERKVRTDIVRFIAVVSEFLYSVLRIIPAADEIRHLVTATRNADIVIGRGTAHVVEVVVPVEVG